MTAFEILSIFIGILALLISFDSLIVAVLWKAIHKRCLPFSIRETTSENKKAYPSQSSERTSANRIGGVRKDDH